jgi:plastocyanin
VGTVEVELATTPCHTAHAAARFSCAWEEEPVPFQERITIEGNTQGGSGAVFEPDPLDIAVLDQIFWTNRDSEPHWPGRVQDDGTIDTTFFMPNQIAPNGDSSPIFSPSTAGTLDYACSLHPDETGTINVT